MTAGPASFKSRCAGFAQSPSAGAGRLQWPARMRTSEAPGEDGFWVHAGLRMRLVAMARDAAMRFLLRLVGYLLIAAGFVSLVIDGARSIANAELELTALAETFATLLGERHLQIQPAIERNIHPLLWDPVMLGLMRAPTALVALLLGFLLLRLGARPDAPIGIVTRR